MVLARQIIFRIKALGHHLLRSVSRYRIHSPYIYSLITKGLKSSLSPEASLSMRQLKKNIHGVPPFTSEDAGTGVNRTLGGPQLLKMGISHPYGKMLYGISKHLKPNNILEIGTSAGISAAYMALGNPHAKIKTVEACKNKALIAKDLMEKNNFHNVSVIYGYGNEVLDQLAKENYKAQMVYVDADHSWEGTVGFFHQLTRLTTRESIIILDDIYWSADMQRAWKHITNQKQVTLSLATMRLGMVFFHPKRTKQQLYLQL